MGYQLQPDPIFSNFFWIESFWESCDDHCLNFWYHISAKMSIEMHFQQIDIPFEKSEINLWDMHVL